MKTSESVDLLNSAMSKAQAEMQNPHFDSANPHFKSRYASLAAVRDAVVPVLAKHGLSIVQPPVMRDGTAGCEWRLSHDSGQWFEGELLLPVDKLTAHGVGSAVTYSRRYTLQAIAGVAAEEDDDGNAAVNGQQSKGAQSVRHGKAEQAAARTKAVADFAETERQAEQVFGGDMPDTPNHAASLLSKALAIVVNCHTEEELNDCTDRAMAHKEAGRLKDEELIRVIEAVAERRKQLKETVPA